MQIEIKIAGIFKVLQSKLEVCDVTWTCFPLLQMTSVTLEDLPGCSLSTLAQCAQLRFLSLRRCGLTALESVNQLQQLAYVDVQVDGEVM